MDGDVDSSSKELSQRKRLRLSNYDYSQGGGYFITVTAIQHLPLFGRMQDKQVQLNEVGAMVQMFWEEQPQHYPGVLLDAFVVMPDHIHGIVILHDPCIAQSSSGPVRGPAPTPGDVKLYSKADKPMNIPLLMRHFKSLTTKRYYEIKDRHSGSRLPDQLWQRSYYERIIRSESDFEEKREYIVTNPLRRWLKLQQQ